MAKSLVSCFFDSRCIYYPNALAPPLLTDAEKRPWFAGAYYTQKYVGVVNKNSCDSCMHSEPDRRSL